MSRRKFSPQFERDYKFYLSNKHIFTIPGSFIKNDFGIQYPGEPELIQKDEDGNDVVIPFSIPYSASGKDAKRCFYLLDTNGEKHPCSEPQLLVEILTCKAAVNLQIKLWAQGRADCTLFKFELEEWLADFKAPEWVLKAIENQKIKIIQQQFVEKKWKEHPFYLDALSIYFFECLKEINIIGNGYINSKQTYFGWMK